MKLQTKKRINPVSKKRAKSRVGKLGIVRLAGADLTRLRFNCFRRDNWRCVECAILVGWGPLTADTPQDIWMEVREIWDWEPIGQMAHIGGKRNHGDVLANVRTLCPDDHTKEHSYGKALQKPCPKRERPA